MLLEFCGRESLARLSRGRLAPAEFDAFWRSPVADALYTGRSSPSEFAQGAVAALGLPVSPEAFLDEFRTWFRGPYPGALELVARVRRRVPVACLSNTNALDVGRFRDELALDRRFDFCFFSNEIGWRKPAAESYRVTLRALGWEREPDRVAFFDDSPECVAGAKAAGMAARHVTTLDELRRCLRELSVLPSGRRPPGA